MKKQKSSTIVLTEFSSSDDNDETEKAMPKIDKKELRKYLQNSDDDESQQNKTSPQKSKRVLHKVKTSSQDEAKKVISKNNSQNILVQGDDFKRLQKKAKKLGVDSL